MTTDVDRDDPVVADHPEYGEIRLSMARAMENASRAVCELIGLQEEAAARAHIATAILLTAARYLEKSGRCAPCVLRHGLEFFDERDRAELERGHTH